MVLPRPTKYPHKIDYFMGSASLVLAFQVPILIADRVFNGTRFRNLKFVPEAILSPVMKRTRFANVLDGTVIGRCMQRHRHQEYIRFPFRDSQPAPCPMVEKFGVNGHHFAYRNILSTAEILRSEQ